jgi:heme exporter protein D
MEAINHIGFIVAAYAAAAAVVIGLIAWVTLDYRAQKRRLNDFETRGIARRSTPSGAEQAMAQLKEKA